MDTYLLFTDSAADLPSSVYEKYDIRIIPMDYELNGEIHSFFTNAPDHNEACDRLYEAQRAGADVHTSQITPFRYLESWKPLLEEGHDILYICFSSGMSATYDNAVQAVSMLKEDFPERTIEVVDSLAATGGQGLLTECAAIKRAEGLSLAENAAWLRDKVPYMCHRFTVGDLDYLHRGGRVSAAVAIVGGLLNIKPLLIIDEEGKLENVAKARGTNAALKALVRSYQHEMGVPDVPKIIYITHSSLYEKAEGLKNMVRLLVGDDTRIEVIPMTPIIGVHTGPDFFAVCGWGFHRTEAK